MVGGGCGVTRRRILVALAAVGLIASCGSGAGLEAGTNEQLTAPSTVAASASIATSSVGEDDPSTPGLELRGTVSGWSGSATQ